MAEVGALIRTHRVDTARRARLAAGVFAAGLAALVCGNFLVALGRRGGRDDTYDIVPWAILGCALGLLLVGGLLGWRSLRRRGEAIELHTGGVVHTWRHHSRTVAWTDMGTITDQGSDRGLAPALGGEVNCRIEVAGGKPLAFTALTEDAADLLAAIRRAVEDGVRPEPPD
jgi:hypothetical protein